MRGVEKRLASFEAMPPHGKGGKTFFCPLVQLGKMTSIDCRGVKRGKCLNCDSCDEFMTENGSIKCAYCNCVPGGHEKSEEIESAKSEQGHGENLGGKN